MAGNPKSRSSQKNARGRVTPHNGWRTPLEERVARVEPDLRSRRSQLIRQILKDSEETYFLSSRDLAKRYGVDAATIVRTIQALGYERYADFVSDLRSHFVLRITPYTVMKAAAGEKRSLSDHILHSLEMDAHNLNALRSELDAAHIIAVAKRIDRARRILVAASDFATTLSYHLAYGLVALGFDAEAPAGSAGNLQQKVNLLGQRDLLIAISFGRGLRVTVDSAIRARDRGIPTFGITDSDRSPLAAFCDESWIVSTANPALNASYVAPIAAINALLAACAHLRPQRSLELLKRKEEEFQSGTRWYSPIKQANSRTKKSLEDRHDTPAETES